MGIPILLLVIIIQAVVPEILPGFADDDAREQKQGDKVRNGHEGIDHIGEVPQYLLTVSDLSRGFSPKKNTF